jgi:nitrate reductase NapAB chaperone NapD
MKVTQVELENVGHPAKMVCWLNRGRYKFKTGTILSLEGVDGLWKVSKVYSTQDHYSINRKWDVGGL